ncbi:MAG: mandelate racemase/muconate lactonizing enzyme family protein [Chloroflexota bacterium]|nr:mandelate racemase/muconate lactonizing enzyme family protein [Chloroflexota bacterium]
MKITDIEAIVMVWPSPEHEFWTALRPAGGYSELVIRIHTDNGIVGIGEAHGSGLPFPGIYKKGPDGQIYPEGASKIVIDLLKPMLIGQDPRDTERLWDEMFKLNHSIGWATHGWGRPQIMTAIAGIDIALWDIKGKAANMPVYQLLGGTRNRVPCYVTGGYYQEGKTISDLVSECESYVDMGFNAIKLKIGHVSLREDFSRIKAVRDSLGYDIDIMLDVNEGYDVFTAIESARMMAPLQIRWLEEPVHWYDSIEGLAQVAASTDIPIASGESAANRWQARDLILRGGIKIMQFDCTRHAGITECLKVASMCATQNIKLAPHHDPQVHGHLVAALPIGEIVETFPTGDRDPIWEEMFSIRPEIENGELRLLDRPGWGFDLDEEVLEKRGVWA